MSATKAGCDAWERPKAGKTYRIGRVDELNPHSKQLEDESFPSLVAGPFVVTFKECSHL